MIVDIFRRVNGSFAIHPVLVASCRFRRVEAGLETSGDQSRGSTKHITGGITYLNEVLALGFGHQRLKFGGGEGINEAGFRHDEQEYLSAGQDGQLVCLNPKMIGLVSIRSRISSFQT